MRSSVIIDLTVTMYMPLSNFSLSLLLLFLLLFIYFSTSLTPSLYLSLCLSLTRALSPFSFTLFSLFFFLSSPCVFPPSPSPPPLSLPVAYIRINDIVNIKRVIIFLCLCSSILFVHARPSVFETCQFLNPEDKYCRLNLLKY